MRLYLDPLPKISIHSMPQSEIYYIYVPETTERPEKRYVLNETALEIIKLYDGTNTYAEIINHLSEKYKEKSSDIEKKVNTFLNQLNQYGYSIKEQTLPIHHNCIINKFKNLYPAVVNLELIEKCNLMCKHCYGEYSASNEKVMALEEVEFILKSLKEIGTHTIEITGGEPSIHPDISLILKKVDEIGIPTVMFLTNGLYLNDELLEVMKTIKNKLFVQVSLHTLNSEYYDWFTGSKHKLNIVKDNIKRLVQNNIKVRVTAIITPKNIDDIVEIGDWAFNNGAKLYAPSIVVSLGRATDINEFDNLYLKDIKEYQKLQDSINKIVCCKIKLPNIAK
jgi:MoaA/NifB/PqqE/SkfB family radical SAM enzyme